MSGKLCCRICGCLFPFLFLLLPCMAFASDFLSHQMELPSSPNPVGSGARAVGMGGAFIAVADDATAASWNPGGLVQVERPEVSAAGAGFHRIEDNTFKTNPEADGEQSVSETKLNYLSLLYPFRTAGKNMAVSMSYQHLYDFEREWNYPTRTRDSDSLFIDRQVDYRLSGSLSAIGVSYCVALNHDLSVGFTWNIWEDGVAENQWEERRFQAGSGVYEGEPFDYQTLTVDRYSLKGVNSNFNLGLLWRISSSLTLGAVVKTPLEADLEHQHLYSTRLDYRNLPAEYDQVRDDPFSSRDAVLDLPLSYGMGLAYRFNDRVMVSLDIYRTEWEDFSITDAQGNVFSPVTGKLASESGGIDPTHQIRAGIEYYVPYYKQPFALCGGVFYDPAPSEGAPDDFFGFSIGSGIQTERMGLDLAYQFRYGDDVGDTILESRRFSQDVYEHSLMASLIVYF